MRRGRQRNRWIQRACVHAVLIVACLVTIFPIYWGIATSLKTKETIDAFPPEWLPNPVTLENYRLVLESDMPRYYANSLWVAGCAILVTLLIASHAGYAAARFEFRGKRALLFVILCTVMVAGIAVLIPLYMLSTKLHVHNTYTVLVVVYSAWQIPTALWLMQGFFESIPEELEEAALVDGASRLRALYAIVLPLARPGLAAAAVVIFVYVWNEFIIAVTLTATNDMRTVPVGLYFYITAYGIDWGKLLAGVGLAIVPVLILFVFLQRSFIKGLTAGATKG
jgi:ABC-type glycerol-3-phosphate transport system permease component